MATSFRPNVVSDKCMSVAEAAWVAGFIDGEGTITLGLYRDKSMRRGLVKPYVTAANTNLVLLDALVEKTGNGAIQFSGGRESENRKLQYKWTIWANQTRHVLPQILPFLEGKRRQAEIVMEFLGLREQRADGSWSRGWTDVHIPRVEALINEVRQLNSRGVCEAGQFVLPISDGKERDRFCCLDGCELRRYRGHNECYRHYIEKQGPRQFVCEYCAKSFERVTPKKTRFCCTRCQWRSAAERRADAAPA